jgi:hypothetical protein
MGAWQRCHPRSVARRVRSRGTGRCALVAGLLGAATTSGPTVAAAADGEALLEGLQLHGFVSQGFLLTTSNDYLANGSTEGSPKFSEVGLNLTKELTDELQLGVQLFARNLGWSGNYNAQFDWLYLDYRGQDWLGVRLGRLKIPYGLHNEIQDIDAARVPILLPGSVYPIQTREILFAQTGAELYGFLRSDPLGALDYRLFAGAIYLDSDSLTPTGAPFESELDIRYVVGGRLIWETPLEGLRVGFSAQKLRLNAAFIVPTGMPVPAINLKNDTWLWAASLEHTVSELTLTAEYARWYADQVSDQPMFSPPLEQTSEKLYGMVSYRLTPWLYPAAYYALGFEDTRNREGRESFQHDTALTLRFDVNPHWIVKLEGHYMYGTAGLLSPLRINPPDVTRAEEHWAVFLAKVTAYF